MLMLHVYAQTPDTIQLQKEITLQLPAGDGIRSGAVVWDPSSKHYYAPIAGGADRLLAVFNVRGKKISNDTLKTLFDVRGIWYVPSLKTLCANGANDNGWISYVMNSDDNPQSTNLLFIGMNQPDEQSVGVFNDKENVVYFLKGQHIASYNFATGELLSDTMRLHVGSANQINAYSNADEDDENTTPTNYNYTSVVYTGLPGTEFGLLNVIKKRIELYDKNSGYVTKVLSLPEDAEPDAMLCFSYTNKMYWLFDSAKRAWIGYK